MQGVSTVHHVPAEGPLLRSGAEAIEVMYSAEADWIAVPVARLDPAFFDLSSGLAGEFVQKFVNYGQRLAIVGEIRRRVQRFATSCASATAAARSGSSPTPDELTRRLET